MLLVYKAKQTDHDLWNKCHLGVGTRSPTWTTADLIHSETTVSCPTHNIKEWPMISLIMIQFIQWR